jgi:tripartite-type tricarboxylate transporter receptor subunit TctC
VLGAKRTPALPKLPTIAESGVPGYAYENWYGVFMPGRTPMDIVLKTQQEITRMMNDPEIEKKLVSQGLDPVGSTHAEFVRFYEEEIVKNGKLIASINMEAR